MSWQPIETAPLKDHISDGSQYGPYILATDGYAVTRVRWWQSLTVDPERFRNFLDDGGNAFRATHWMPLPKPPKGSTVDARVECADRLGSANAAHDGCPVHHRDSF